MHVATLVGLVVVVFAGGVLLGAAVVKLRARALPPSIDDELRGWAACERALYEELGTDERTVVLRRVRNRVPPHLRLAHEEVVADMDARRRVPV